MGTNDQHQALVPNLAMLTAGKLAFGVVDGACFGSRHCASLAGNDGQRESGLAHILAYRHAALIEAAADVVE